MQPLYNHTFVATHKSLMNLSKHLRAAAVCRAAVLQCFWCRRSAQASCTPAGAQPNVQPDRLDYSTCRQQQRTQHLNLRCLAGTWSILHKNFTADG